MAALLGTDPFTDPFMKPSNKTIFHVPLPPAGIVQGESMSFRSLWSLFNCLIMAFVTVPATAQIQQAWVAHYNNGFTNGTHQAVKMALDSSGNIYVSGFSQNTNSNLGYVTIKYAPNGNQVWVSRYDSTNYPTATPAALVLDSSNNVLVTGSALTIKYDINGNQLWTAPYGGTALAEDSHGNSYVTGFDTNFNTVKLSSTGSNLWLTTYKDVGPTVGQAIVVDTNGSAYVFGSDTFEYYGNGASTFPAVELLVIKYAANGSQTWLSSYQQLTPTTVQVNGASVDASVGIVALANIYPNGSRYLILDYDFDGNMLWAASPRSSDGVSRGQALAVDGSANCIVTGLNGRFYPNYCYGTFKLSASGSNLWTNNYPLAPVDASAATSIAVDSANNCYVTGYSPGTNSLNDIVTIKYGPNGNQVWLQRYNGPGNGNDVGNAIAVDNNGNVYVAGYDTTTAGGTEMVLIKYSPITVKKQANGTILLQAQGYAGESFDIQATADLLNWLDLGIVTADTNGLMQYDDTNAPNYSARFYGINPQ